ncbi:hypothetical protein CEK25_005729 [Fusarium fujikuroi]|nr:hypothetical protein CEK25_005729 [Fusarium fujikuroi]
MPSHVCKRINYNACRVAKARRLVRRAPQESVQVASPGDQIAIDFYPILPRYAGYSSYSKKVKNGGAERVAAVIIQKSRAMRAGAKIPKYLWPESIKAATYLYNRMLSVRRQHKSPYKIFHLECTHLANKEPDKITDKNVEFISPKANNSAKAGKESEPYTQFRFKLLPTPPESPPSGFFHAIEDDLKVKRGGKPAPNGRPKVIRVKRVWPALRTCQKEGAYLSL